MATDEKMKIAERYQYLQRMLRRYREADRGTKRALLDEMEAHTGMHRKALLRRLHSDLERKA
ncbi:MAG: integrase, partial [Anaerolineae bacterium]|nr:integrase [Anaerolineae bacterium]